MTDNVLVDNGEETDYEVSTDDAGAAGHVQRVKLAYSADGVATHVPADADGLLVNLGTNNDVVVSGDVGVTGTVTVDGSGVTQPVSGPLTDAELRADPVVVDLGANNDVTVAGVSTAAKQDSQITLLAGGLPAALAAGGGLKVEGVAGGVAVPISVATIPSHAVTNAGVFAVQVDGNALTALQLADDVVAVLGTDTYTEATSKATVIAAVRRDADTTLVNTTNEYTPLQVDANGRLKVEAFSGETLPVSGTVTVTDGSGSLTVDGTVSVNLNAGTATNEVVGDIAHGTAVGGNPLLTGLEGRSTAPTAVDDGDVVRALATLLGKQVNLPFALPASTKSYASSAAVTDTADDEAFAAVASTRTYITSIQVFNADATVGTEVVIKDGSTVLWRGYCAAAGGGCSAVFAVPLRGTANTAVNVANITTSAETYFNLQGYNATE